MNKQHLIKEIKTLMDKYCEEEIKYNEIEGELIRLIADINGETNSDFRAESYGNKVQIISDKLDKSITIDYNEVIKERNKYPEYSIQDTLAFLIGIAIH